MSDASRTPVKDIFQRRHHTATARETIPLWRREELWKVHTPEARVKAEMCEDFEYCFEACQALDACETSAPDRSSIPRIHILENHDQIGHRVWDGATLLCKTLEHLLNEGKTAYHDYTDFAGKNILEVGAGTAIVSMVIAKLCDLHGLATPTIIATDIPAVVPQMDGHIRRNGLQHIVHAQPLVWGNEAHENSVLDSFGELTGHRHVDIIVASDLAAPVGVAADLIATLARLSTMQKASPKLLMISQVHREFTGAFFESIDSSEVFRLQDIPPSEWPEAYRTDRHRIVVGTIGNP